MSDATLFMKRTILYAAICFLTGCLAHPPLDKQSFVFAPPTAAAKPAAGNRILGISSLQVAEPFDGRSFVYRTGEFSYEHDTYAEFMSHPADELLAPISDALRDSGDFSAVTEMGSAVKPNTLLEVQVLQLYGDFRPSTPPAAVLTMRFVFIDAPGDIAGAVISQHEYTRTIPLKSQTASALMAGWNEALYQILDSAASDFAQAGTTESK